MKVVPTIHSLLYISEYLYFEAWLTAPPAKRFRVGFHITTPGIHPTSLITQNMHE
jgi:hypothetical protein